MNKYNILALGRWDCLERRYQAKDGDLILFDRQDLPVLKGSKIASGIYKFKMQLPNALNISYSKSYIFSCTEVKQSWETWHKRFGHVSYDGLKKLHAKGLIEGFTVDASTPTLDCVSCTEVKQSRKPFEAKSDTRRTNKGELTHMDLWGKYDIASLQGDTALPVTDPQVSVVSEYRSA
jgi:hypothetical protein